MSARGDHGNTPRGIKSQSEHLPGLWDGRLSIAPSRAHILGTIGDSASDELSFQPEKLDPALTMLVNSPKATANCRPKSEEMFRGTLVSVPFKQKGKAAVSY